MSENNVSQNVIKVYWGKVKCVLVKLPTAVLDQDRHRNTPIIKI